MRSLLILTAALTLGSGTISTAQVISPNQTSQDAARRGTGVITPQTGGENSSVVGNGADTNASDRPKATLPDWANAGRAPIGDPTSASATEHATPAALNAHQRACADRYRTYDPATDTYYARPGVKAQCALP
jgi:hypothetical protein